MASSLLNKLKEINIKTNITVGEYNLNVFKQLESKDVERYLDFIKNNYEIVKHFDNSSITEKNLSSGVISILLILDSLINEEKDIFSLKIKFFNLIDILDKEIKENIYNAYILSGLYFIYKEFEGSDLLKIKKSLIKYLINIGLIEEGIWGLKLNLNILEDFVKNLDGQKLEKIFIKNKPIPRSDLDILFKNKK